MIFGKKPGFNMLVLTLVNGEVGIGDTSNDKPRYINVHSPEVEVG